MKRMINLYNFFCKMFGYFYFPRQRPKNLSADKSDKLS